jgi:predicted metal-dependent phosphoesterase TrpH
MKFDLHIHTSRYSPDSELEPLALVRRARELGLDGVVITEHDWLWTESELEKLREAAPGLVVLSGIEVSAREGHTLAYGVANPYALPRGIGLAELCRQVHAQGGVAVAAHPFRWGQEFDRILQRTRAELDGLELMSSNMDEDARNLAAGTWRQYKLAGLGNSDAHHEDVVGVCYTEFAENIRDGRDLVNAIRNREMTAHDRLAEGG